jgi:hypothetical protein
VVSADRPRRAPWSPVGRGVDSRVEPSLPHAPARTSMRTTLLGTLFYAVPLVLSVGIAIPNRPPERDLVVVSGRLLPEDEPDEVDLEVMSPEVEPEAEVIEVVTEPVGEPSPGAEAPPVATAEDGAAPAPAAEDGAGAARPGVKAPNARPGTPRKGKNKLDCTKPHPHVRAGEDGIVEIDRSLVDEYTQNLQTFMTLGFSRPYDEDGIKGWYVSGFNCTSPVHKAGFRRGDVLLEVNGKNTRSWVGVFLLYQKLKNQADFEIKLVRKGQATTLRFRVVG